MGSLEKLCKFLFFEPLLSAKDYFIAEAHLVAKDHEQRCKILGKAPPFTGQAALTPSLKYVLLEKEEFYKQFCEANPAKSKAYQDAGKYPVVDLDQNELVNFNSHYLPTLVTHGHMFSLDPSLRRDLLGDEHEAYQLVPTFLS